MNIFLKELKTFSRENWWVYLILSIALTIVYLTWKGNLLEIILLFLANFLWNLFIMAMQWSYSSKNNKIWWIYQLSSTIVFSAIAIYWLIVFDQSQYLIWQVAYFWAAMKAFIFYNYDKDIKLLNEKIFIFLNIILFTIFIKFFEFQTFQILQWIWFALITTWLVSIKDNIRYWLNVIWIFLLVSGSAWWVYNSFISWNVDWIALGYFILTLTVFIYYLKLIKKYI